MEFSIKPILSHTIFLQVYYILSEWISHWRLIRPISLLVKRLSGFIHTYQTHEFSYPPEWLLC